MLDKTFSLYSNFYYLINPREQNGTSSLLEKAPTPVQIKNESMVNSVPDQYTVRAGINISLNRFIASTGIRAEGIPVYDLVDGSNGNCRAGYNISVEPGVIYNLERTSVIFYLPMMIKRAIKQTVPDKIASDPNSKVLLPEGLQIIWCL